MAEKLLARHVKIAGRPFDLNATAVGRAMRNVDPEPIASHYVVIGSRRFPPKQVIGEVTGLDRADFTSHQARRTLMRLGFVAGRRGAGGGGSHRGAEPTLPARDSLADRLGPLAGEWVAIKDDDLLYAADSPQELVGWLSRHGQRADSMFRVPESDVAAVGLAPL